MGKAQRDGFQLRVAVIASPGDLGSVTELWHQPQNYARFLGQELSLVYRGAVLVVMPNGYGLYRVGGALGAEQSVLSGISAPGRRLGRITLRAVERLGGASGHPLTLASSPAASPASSTDVLAWMVFAIGSAAILLAWTASLRAQSLHIRGRGASGR